MSRKPVFDPVAAEECFACLADSYRAAANEVFWRDNRGRAPSRRFYSAEYHRCQGMYLAMRAVLDYFARFDLGK